MARDSTIKFLRASRADLNTQATASNLLVGEPYLTTDESRLAVGLTANSYTALATQNDLANKANISGANTFTGNQTINGELTVTTARKTTAEPYIIFQMSKLPYTGGSIGYRRNSAAEQLLISLETDDGAGGFSSDGMFGTAANISGRIYFAAYIGSAGAIAIDNSRGLMIGSGIGFTTAGAEISAAGDIKGKTLVTTGAVTASNISGTNTGDETNSTILSKLVSSSGGGTTNFLRADGTWAPPSQASNIHSPLNIWTARTAPNTHNAFIAGIDSEFSGEISSGAVIKTNRGLTADGVTPAYSYTAGSGKLTALLIGGLHGTETLGSIALLEWFSKFVKSNNPTMVTLRESLRVIYIPALNASKWSVLRENANNVNLNRNFPFFWDRAVNEAKGSAPLSEAETQIIKSILDNENVSCFIDFHNYGADYTTKDIEVLAPSSWVLGNRRIHQLAMGRYADLYNATWGPQGNPRDAAPISVHWANYYLLYVKNRPHAVTALFEVNSNLHGSSGLSMTSAAALKMCGAINTFILTWLNDGMSPPQAYSFQQYANRAGSADTTSITAGGTLVDTTTLTPISYDVISPTSTAGARTYLEQVAPCPGSFKIEFGSYFEGSANSDSRLLLYLYHNGVQVTALVGTVRTATDREGMSRVHTVHVPSVDASTVHKFEVYAQRSGSNIKIKGAWLHLTFTPNTDIQPIPAVN